MNVRERPIGSDALTDKERAVLDLHDRGLTPRQIAHAGHAPSFVKYVIGHLTVSIAHEQRLEAKVRQASRDLAAACIATGSCFR